MGTKEAGGNHKKTAAEEASQILIIHERRFVIG